MHPWKSTRWSSASLNWSECAGASPVSFRAGRCRGSGGCERGALCGYARASAIQQISAQHLLHGAHLAFHSLHFASTLSAKVLYGEFAYEVLCVWRIASCWVLSTQSWKLLSLLLSPVGPASSGSVSFWVSTYTGVVWSVMGRVAGICSRDLQSIHELQTELRS